MKRAAPVVVNTRYELVAGARRLAAVADLGWNEVPCQIVATLDEALAAIQAERDENTCREPLAPTDMVSLGKHIESLEKPAAKERQQSTRAKKGQKVGEEGGGKFPPPSAGKTRDKVGAALGVSGKKYEKAKQVAEAAEKEPEKFGDLPAKMDTESVDAAHRDEEGHSAALRSGTEILTALVP